MKKLILPIAICATLFTSFAFTGSGPCNINDYFVTGTSTKTGTYKADGTLTGTETSTVTSVSTSGDSTIAVIATSYVDAKNKDQSHDGSIRMICLNNMLLMDLGGMMSSMMGSQGKDMKIVMKGGIVPYKTSYTAGEKLDDINMTMEMYNGTALFATSDIHITNRVVDAIEDHTTPAGTFNCYKISSTNSVVMHMGAMNMPQKASKSVEWYSPKAGMVRSEAYKDGNLFSYNELLSFTKP
ncbi:MAG TPA: hypothetical protein VL651_13305 [Bacteroidia bacterium]|jgi:hypothetical protein|nr:hypothetical protein [Bacteroidia bacterium]